MIFRALDGIKLNEDFIRTLKHFEDLTELYDIVWYIITKKRIHGSIRVLINNEMGCEISNVIGELSKLETLYVLKY